MQDMWPESSAVNAVNLIKILQFQRYRIFPGGLLFFGAPPAVEPQYKTQREDNTRQIRDCGLQGDSKSVLNFPVISRFLLCCNFIGRAPIQKRKSWNGR